MHCSLFNNGIYRKSAISALSLGFMLYWGTIPVKAQSGTLPPLPQIVAESTATSNEAALKKQATMLIELAGNQQFDKMRALLAPEIKEKWSAKKLQALWNDELISVTGPYVKVIDTEVIDAVNASVVKVKVQFEKRTDNLLITFNKEQQIIGVNFPQTQSIDQIAVAFVEALGAKDYGRARGYLHPGLKAEFFPNTVKRGWENLQATTGAYQKLLGTEIRRSRLSAGDDLVIVNIKFDKVIEQLFVIFDENGRIVGIDYPDVD